MKTFFYFTSTKEFSIEVEQNNQWVPVANGTTIGYKRILRITPVTAQKVRLVIKDSKACPVIAMMAVF